MNLTRRAMSVDTRQLSAGSAAACSLATVKSRGMAAGRNGCAWMVIAGAVCCGFAPVAMCQSLDHEIVDRTPRPCELPPSALEDSRSLWEPNLWPDGVVFYEFDANTSAENRSDMRAAMDRLEEVAFVRFVARTNESDYLHILDDTGNFVEHIGYNGGPQNVHIYNWKYRYIMIHELMHVLGVRHEQSRADRESYITVHEDRIQDGKESQYAIQSGTPLGLFDFDSVMCYGRCTFSICCPLGEGCSCSGEDCWTMTATPEYQPYQELMGQRTHLSSGDIAGLLSKYPPPAIQWYRFDEGDAGTAASVVVDTGSDGHDGAATGSAIYSANIPCIVPTEGESLSMTGGVVTVGAPFPFNIAGDKTIAFWMFSPINSHGAIVWGRTDATDSNRFQIYTNSDGTVGYDFRDPSGALHCLSLNCGAFGGVVVPRNTWAHFMLVREGSTYRCYVNGVLARTSVDGSTNFPNAASWTINGRPCCKYVGLIDDLRFYDEAMTPDQVILTPVLPHVELASPSAITCPDNPDWTFSVFEVSGTGPFTYQWRKDSVYLSDNGHLSGTATATLHIHNPVAGDAGAYSCVVSNCAGSDSSIPATLAVCTGDFNCDGFVNGDDYDWFAILFEDGSDGADVNNDGFVNGDDYDVLAGAFDAGC